MNNEELVAQLQVMSGGGLVMSTDQLARALSMNAKVISRLRQAGRFPIPHKLIGSKIVYSLVAVANYLLSDDPEPQAQSPSSTRIEPTKSRASKARAPLPDLSRKMLMRGFAKTLELQQSSIEQLLLVLQKKIMADDLQSTLPVNSNVKRVIKEYKI